MNARDDQKWYGVQVYLEQQNKQQDKHSEMEVWFKLPKSNSLFKFQIIVPTKSNTFPAWIFVQCA